MAILLSKQWRLCFKLFIGGCVFFFIIASTVAFDHSLKLDFPELYCRTINECCQDRQDHCSLPIACMYLANVQLSYILKCFANFNLKFVYSYSMLL